jgi:hypothetical protein
MKDKSETRNILVFENDDEPGMRVAAELRKSADRLSFRVLPASALPAVSRMLKARPVAVIVIDVGRKTGEALDAVRLLSKNDHAIPLYVYNGFMLPRIAEKSREYPQVQYFEDHRNLDRFIALILDEVSRKKRGIIHGVALGSFLQLLNNEKFNGRIVVTAGTRKGTLSLSNGQLTGADLDGSGHDLALAEMSSWEKVTVEIDEKAPPPDPGISPPRAGPPIAIDPGSHSGRIDMLHFLRSGKRLSIDIGMLKSELSEIKDQLGDGLLRADVFLSSNGRSLAGWNSHHLACSLFASLTEVLMNSLAVSHFSPLGKYYLIDLSDEQQILLVVSGELQLGMLIKGGKDHQGFWLNIIVPRARQILEKASAGNISG